MRKAVVVYDAVCAVGMLCAFVIASPLLAVFYAVQRWRGRMP